MPVHRGLCTLLLVLLPCITLSFHGLKVSGNSRPCVSLTTCIR